MKKKVGPSILGAIFGLVAGVGLYLFLTQNGNIDALSKVGLIFPVGGVVLGVLAGSVGGRRPH